MAVRVGHQFVRLLRGGIQAERVVNVVVHRERHRRIGPVDRTRRGIGQMLDVLVAAPFEDVHEAHEVAADVGLRVLQRVTHSGLGREVDHLVELVLRKKSLDPRLIGQIEMLERETLLRRETIETIPLQLHRVVVVQAVEPDDFVAAVNKPT